MLPFHPPTQVMTKMSLGLQFSDVVDIPEQAIRKPTFQGIYCLLAPSSLDVDQNIAEMAVSLNAMDIQINENKAITGSTIGSYGFRL